MNQQRLQSYINLIQKLLACPSGEEWILLRQNEALVTPELVQVMEQVATQLANQGNLKEAKFLHNLAGQIHHLFVAQTVQRSEEDDQSEAYLQLIQSLLACPKGSEGELLAANQELIDPGLVHMMQQVAAQLAAKGDLETANYLQHWATELNRLWLQQHNRLHNPVGHSLTAGKFLLTIWFDCWPDPIARFPLWQLSEPVITRWYYLAAPLLPAGDCKFPAAISRWLAGGRPASAASASKSVLRAIATERSPPVAVLLRSTDHPVESRR
jgi:hypothetical protein